MLFGLTTLLAIATTLSETVHATWTDAHGSSSPTTIFHTVLFELKPTLTEADRQEFCNALLSLKEKCLSPVTHQPYILASSGGADNSPEMAEHNFTHGFVSEFASLADRDYFVFQEPLHQAWKAAHRAEWVDVLVLDFEKGVF